MREVVFLVLSILLSPNGMEANGVDLHKNRFILLEAHYSSRGMLSWRDGEHLIARIYSDGVVEYEDVEVKKRIPRVHLRRTTISENELIGLMEFLKSNDVQGLASKYSAFTPTIDHSENLLLKITSGSRVKEIMVENFKPNLPNTIVRYPKALLEVACWTELVRKNARARFFFREPTATCKLP